MNAEFFDALAMLEKEKGIPMEYLAEKQRIHREALLQ